jgi:hypothetical protein
LVEGQTFTYPQTSSNARAFIAHFINATSSYVKVRNSDRFSAFATDGTYTIRNLNSASAGCLHYARFISQSIHGINNDAITDRLRPQRLNNRYNADMFRDFVLREAQAGERMRFAGHTIVFVAATNDGFYFLEYEGNNHDPYLSYASYTHFVTFLNNSRNADFFLSNQDKSVNRTVEAATVTSVTTNNGNVTVNWDAVEDATNYNVYLLQAPWGWYNITHNANKSAEFVSHTFENVPAGEYVAFVISRPNDNFAQSDWYAFTVGDAPIAPVLTEYAALIAYDVTRNNAPIRSNYYQTGEVLRNLPLNSVVWVNGHIYNSHGNRWYRVNVFSPREANGQLNGFQRVVGRTMWIYSGNITRR